MREFKRKFLNFFKTINHKSLTTRTKNEKYTIFLGNYEVNAIYAPFFELGSEESDEHNMMPPYNTCTFGCPAHTTKLRAMHDVFQRKLLPYPRSIGNIIFIYDCIHAIMRYFGVIYVNLICIYP